MPELPDLTADAEGAIHRVVASATSDVALVTKFVLVAEVVDTNGEPGFVDLASPDTSLWASVGLLRASLAGRERALARLLDD